MRMLFLTIAGPESILDRGGYGDLLRTFRDHGHEVNVVCPLERRRRQQTELAEHDGLTILGVRTGSLQKVALPEKLVATMLVERQFISAIAKYFGDKRFDLVMYSTPPITFDRVVRYIKSRDRCTSYLLLKDIFPQNAVDLGLIKLGGLPWRYFRSREQRLYASSDHIGCMSEANVEYVLRNNHQISPGKVEVCPNNIEPLDVGLFKTGSHEMREAYGIPMESTLFVYGGNLGVPQGLGFLLEVLDSYKSRRDVYFLIVGSGTEYSRIDSHLRAGAFANARLLRSLPKNQYDSLLGECDVGLVFLNSRFTIPNFPSRITAYMEAAIPMLAATDAYTDVRDVLRESGGGMWVENGDLEGFTQAVECLAADRSLRERMGRKGRQYLDDHYTSARAYETVMAHMGDR